MAANQARMITSAEIKLLSFLRQNIIRKSLEEVTTQQRDKRDPLVILVVVAYFNLGPSPHGLFHNLVHQLAHSFQVSFVVLNSGHPTHSALCRYLGSPAKTPSVHFLVQKVALSESGDKSVTSSYTLQLSSFFSSCECIGITKRNSNAAVRSKCQKKDGG